MANLVIWQSLYEKQRRVILTASMLGVIGRVQREGEVVHIVAYDLIDLSAELGGVGGRQTVFALPHGRGDEFHRGPSAPDPRDAPVKGVCARDIYIPDLRLGSGIIPGQPTEGIKVKSRDFR